MTEWGNRVAQLQTPSPREQWELAGVVLAVLAGAYAVVRWPLWWTFQKLVMKALEKELAQIAINKAKMEANAHILEAHEESIKAFGVAMRDIPRMSGALVEMTSAVRELKTAVYDLNQDIKSHGNELGRVTGFVDGIERRRRGRRKDDPLVEDDET